MKFMKRIGIALFILFSSVSLLFAQKEIAIFFIDHNQQEFYIKYFHGTQEVASTLFWETAEDYIKIH